MTMFTRPITISLSPNTESDDVALAVKNLFNVFAWKKGKSVSLVEEWFCRYVSVPQAVSFNSGRSALLAILKSFDIGPDDEVLVQAFTCVAVPNGVLWAGAKPVFVDIDDTLNMNPVDAEKKISKRTKAIILQHTFGVPAQIEKFVKICKKYNILLIEDCAHALGASYKGQKVGLTGDASFFSFGRDKVVSSVFGGMATINPKHKHQNEKLKKYQVQLPYPTLGWIFQQAFHPVAFAVILATYNIFLGKALLVILQKLRLLSFPVYPEEKRGEKPEDFPKKFPNGLAVLAMNQLRKLDRFNLNRMEIAEFYRKQLIEMKIKILPYVEGSMYLRFACFPQDRDAILKKSKHQGVYLGNWYHNIVDPKGVDFTAVGYTIGSCPKAEQAAQQILNLPTRISKDAALKVIQQL